jgi:hypothetical protein
MGVKRFLIPTKTKLILLVSFLLGVFLYNTESVFSLLQKYFLYYLAVIVVVFYLISCIVNQVFFWIFDRFNKKSQYKLDKKTIKISFLIFGYILISFGFYFVSFIYHYTDMAINNIVGCILIFSGLVFISSACLYDKIDVKTLKIIMDQVNKYKNSEKMVTLVATLILMMTLMRIFSKYLEPLLSVLTLILSAIFVYVITKLNP